MTINFISSKDSDETGTMHTRRNNIEIMMGNERNEITKELFESFLQKRQEGLEKKIRGGKFFFDSVNLLHYNLHKISLNRGGSYTDSAKWLKNKKATINPKNGDNKYFQNLNPLLTNMIEKKNKFPIKSKTLEWVWKK